MGAAYQDLTARAPANISSGTGTLTVTGTYDCTSTVQSFVLGDFAGYAAGRWVLLKASSITNYVGATVTPPSGLSVLGVSQEAVNFSGTTWQCVVVTLA